MNEPPAPVALTQDSYHRAKNVRLAVFDVDGVLTDGLLYYSDSGVEIKAFNVRDGQGMKMLQASGVRIAIITSRRSQAMELRARDLGIDLLFQGVSDKLSTCQGLLGDIKMELAAVAYIGDDLPDLPMLMRCGLAVTVPEAPATVRRHAHYITQARGGHGAARELCELIMQAQGTLEVQANLYRNCNGRETGMDGL
jgi:3-deoxy-D-manno-octulosonate 8-phosphate phosphatase (KDO 8-P phosphatase)